MTKANTNPTTQPPVSAAMANIANPEFFRRSLFGVRAAIATLAVAPPASAAVAPHPDAELLAACRDFSDADQELKDAEGRDDDFLAQVLDRWYTALERVTELRTSTVDGLRAKAGVAHAAMISVKDDLQREECAGLAVLVDILGRALA
jgi:phytoene dehydrogenase-like protein